jgi:hypothetical protein
VREERMVGATGNARKEEKPPNDYGPIRADNLIFYDCAQLHRELLHITIYTAINLMTIALTRTSSESIQMKNHVKYGGTYSPAAANLRGMVYQK